MKLLPVLLLLLSFSVYASSDDEIDKQFSIGIGTYGSVITYDQDFAEDDKLSGFSVSFAYAVSDIFAFRGTYFSLEHDDLSALESKGIDLLAHVGFNLASPGFKLYIGGGFFNDKWELAGFDKTFDGLQLSGGIGYNWEFVALDFILNIRDASDYENFVNALPGPDVSATAATGSLLLSFRF
ncbi:MAG: outer membrane beta-barrel protein [Gammaproteobacteria bacterium]